MASKRLNYIDYLKDYEAIASNQKLVNSLLKAPRISKKKPIIFDKEYDASQNWDSLPNSNCRSICSRKIISMIKTRIASSKELNSISLVASAPRVDITNRPNYTRSSKHLVNNFLNLCGKVNETIL